MPRKNTSAEVTFYRYNDDAVEILPYFLYEVSIYKIESTRASLLSCKYYSSNKLLKIKEVEILKTFREYTIERFITLLGAPESFIKENNLPIYELRKPIKKKKK